MAVILVIEDDEDLRSLIAESLQEQGHKPLEAVDSPQALQWARSRTLDLVIADVRLHGQDGIECLRAMKVLQPRARRLVITGYTSLDGPPRAIQVEADDYLYKPFRLETLLGVVERVLGSEQEARRWTGVLSALAAGYRRLVERTAVALASAELASLETVRNRAYQGVYLAVRSRMVSVMDFQALWERLEGLERDREQLKAPGLHLQERQQLLQGYQVLIDLLEATSRPAGMPLLSRPASQDRQLVHLFGGLQSGAVSCEQLKIAAFLRHLSPEDQPGPELAKLQALLFGALA